MIYTCLYESFDTCVPCSNSDAIKVFLRVRPPEKGSSLLASSPVVEVNADCKSVTLLSRPDVKLFTFDHVADVTSTQVTSQCPVGFWLAIYIDYFCRYDRVFQEDRLWTEIKYSC